MTGSFKAPPQNLKSTRNPTSMPGRGGDQEMGSIPPYKFTLKTRARPRRMSEKHFEKLISTAEQAAEDYVNAHSGALSDDIEIVVRAHSHANKCDWSEESRNDLFLAAHDVRGNASTFHYPLAGSVADNLCRLIAEFQNPGEDSLLIKVIFWHIKTLRAIVRQDIKGAGDDTAHALVKRLYEATNEALESEFLRVVP